jgi:hypothetical protein
LVIHGPVDETKKCSFSAKQNEMEAVCVQGVGDAARRLKVVLLSKTLNVNEDKEYWYVFFFCYRCSNVLLLAIWAKQRTWPGLTASSYSWCALLQCRDIHMSLVSLHVCADKQTRQTDQSQKEKATTRNSGG